MSQRLAQRLPAYMVPGQFVALATLPLTANGKLDIAALPRASSPVAADAAPRSPGGVAGTTSAARGAAVLADVLEAWAEVLGRRPASADIAFFEAGGRSLDVIRLQDSLERRFGLDLDPTFAFEYPSARRQADRLLAIGAGRRGSAVASGSPAKNPPAKS